MDLNSLKPTERMVEIVSPAKQQPLGIRVMLLHIDDERLKKLKRSFQDHRYKMEAKGKPFKAEDFENNANELSFAAMTGWEWYNPTGKPGDEGYDEKAMPSFNGEVPEFNKRNAFAIFETLPWFRNQIGIEMGDDDAFYER